MAYPRRLLADGEDLVLELRPHWIALVVPLGEILLGVAAVIVILLVLPDSWPTWTRWAAVALGIAAALIFALPRLVAWATSHFVVTSDRVIHRSGLIAKRSMEIPLENISDVRFDQGVFERMVGAGRLTLESPGEFGQEVFGDVRQPERVQKLIYEQSEENRRRMATPAAAPRAAASGSVADELDKLERLRQQGVISDPEFQAQKDRLLGS